MEYPLNRNDRVAALRIVAIYAFFSGLWIYISDHVLDLLFRDPASIVFYSQFKGLAFIAVTVCLLYQLIVRHTLELRGADEELRRLNEELEVRVAERTEQLQRRNRELQTAHRWLEEETEKRVAAVEQLRQKEQMMIQQSRMAAVGEMLSTVAHHWRQPLNVLGLKVQEIGFLCRRGAAKEVVEADIAGAMEILRRMSRTIDDFMELSAPDAERRVFKVEEAIAGTLSLVESAFAQRGIAIEASTAGDPRINGYPNAYRQVLLEILMNARDAFGGSPTDARIALQAGIENGMAVVTVTDNAGGIREEIIGAVFQPYFTTKEAGKGSGIGLFIARNIIEKNMGGRLTVRNVDGGTQFRIEVVAEE